MSEANPKPTWRSALRPSPAAATRLLGSNLSDWLSREPYHEALKRTLVASFDHLVGAAKQRGGMASPSGLMSSRLLTVAPHIRK